MMIEHFTYANWFYLETEIAEEIKKYMHRGHFDVEFIPGDVSTLQTSALFFY